ncbi:HAMP domain-containing histidine kinase [Saccharopolyspora indica]|uniref:sensor histidine kinase n=1 Tax=Saccharopolyspora indica TaxID=1229659 RepID=UPI0022EB6053|nr:HAMP domain-containing sensor histidine kinase [Saccharopolyspora indica]MDA3647190.1 HAMP domain-containing sensor histidine kinase [Saccharopolyspora indica]
MNRPAADRLRRLRRLLTALFTALNAAGLLLLATLLLVADRDQRDDRMDAELRLVAVPVLRLLQHGDVLITAYVAQDPLDTQCPQFAVMPASGVRFEPYLSKRSCVPVAAETYQQLADEAIKRKAWLAGYTRSTDGRSLRFGAEPFRDDNGRWIAAVVAVSDAEPEQEARTEFVLLVVGGCALLIAAVAGAGYVLAGRAIRPATAAMEQHETLLAETAHDLRSPVAGLRSLAETALRHPDKTADLLPRTVQLSARMGDIINDLLMRARLAAGVQALAVQPVSLDELVASVVEETPTGGAQVTLTKAPTTVVADPALVQRAVGNLLDNALRYGRQPGAEAIVHITVAGGRIIVADHGPGIDPAVAEEKFDRFASTGGSSGLGLSIVRWVALSHGGVLRVYNAAEGGAIFELAFPASE